MKFKVLGIASTLTLSATVSVFFIIIIKYLEIKNHIIIYMCIYNLYDIYYYIYRYNINMILS